MQWRGQSYRQAENWKLNVQDSECTRIGILYCLFNVSMDDKILSEYIASGKVIPGNVGTLTQRGDERFVSKPSYLTVNNVCF